MHQSLNIFIICFASILVLSSCELLRKKSMIRSTSPTCSYDNSLKSDCGWPSMKRSQCESLGCCFDDTQNTFWCYYKANVPRYFESIAFSFIQFV